MTPPDPEAAEIVKKLTQYKEALRSLACDCTGRCEAMEWLPADNSYCPYRAAALLTQPPEPSS